MEAELWQKIKRIYESALEVSADHRETFLKEACAGDDSLRDQVRSLLECRPAAGDFMKSPAVEIAARSLAQEKAHEIRDLTGLTFLRYRITGKIGEGGMGVVYRAEDVRLGREVALKFLSGELARNAQALQRFQLEARAASALNHPNICTLHDVGEHDGLVFLVMEHLSGETLAERLNRGPLPLDQALDTCAHLAEALDAAHKQGIVHRDLKPGNVMLTKTGPKLLDFGLAKLKKETALSTIAGATQPASLTEGGVIMGTVPYMAPEQLEGRAADARTDLWALGVILYEMISGKPAFEAPSQAGLIAAILERDPAPLSTVHPLTPPLLDRLVNKCLAKNPDGRWDSAHDVADELRWIREGGEVAGTVGETARRHARWKWTAVGSSILFGLALMTILAMLPVRQTVPPPRIERFAITVPEGLRLAPSPPTMAISPDGTTLVFSVVRDDKRQLCVRRTDEYSIRPLAGAEDALSPTFSPDGKWVAYFVMFTGLMMKIPVDGGPPQQICKVGPEYAEVWGLTWGTDGRIIFGGWPGGISSVPSDGGTPQPLKRPPQGNTHTYYIWPDLLPGGENLLFTIWQDGQGRVANLSLKTGEIQPVIDSASHARYLRSTGHLVYESEGTLFAIGFEPGRLEKRSPAIALVAGVGHALPVSYFDLSANGTLAYIPATSSLPSLVWKDRSGCVEPLNLDRRRYSAPKISPDGQLLVDSIFEYAGRRVWIGKVNGEPLRPLTFSSDAAFPIFTHDGKKILFSMPGRGGYNIFRAPTDGSVRDPERITDSPHNQAATSVSPDGKYLLFNDIDGANADIWQMEIGRPETAHPYITSPKSDMAAQFSPDGHWVAYQSDISGRMEVYIQSYPVPGGPDLVSIGGGSNPSWSPDGSELFYQGPSAILSRRIEGGRAVGPQTQMIPYVGGGFALSHDGRRFLLIDPTTAKSEINIVTNWFEELKARIPVNRN